MKPRSSIGQYLGVLLAERGMNQRDLAQKCGVSASYMSEVFLGRKNLGPLSIPKIAAAITKHKFSRKVIEHRLHYLAATDYGFVVAEKAATAEKGERG